MDLIKAIRAPERLYRGVLWLVSVIFAVFLVGFGNLVIGDLPGAVDRQVYEAPAPTAEQQRNSNAIREAERARLALDDRLSIERLKLEQARRDSQNGQETFSAWIAARTATTNPQQDPEVLARTRELEQLKANERALNATIADLESERLEIDQRIAGLFQRNADIDREAGPARERAHFMEELRIFALRLLITLPLLAAAAWMVVKKRKSDSWPLMRGFVLAAVFVFFVELVPYLPSYGGYVRYGVGIILTLAAGHFLIKNMRVYLARRKEVEAQAEQERRSQLSHEEAFRKMSARTCPGCDRPIATTGDAEANFCVHCGMTLFDRCPGCNTRKMAFFRYCMTCGTPAAPAAPATPGHG